MRRLTLYEYQTTAAVELTLGERDQLQTVAPSISITPSSGRTDAYDLKPSSWVGSVHIGDLELIVRPKLAIEQVLFLVSYAVSLGRWGEAPAALAETDSVVEAIIPGFTYQLRQALGRGVLQGYRSQDDALRTVRGRWRIGDQVGQRFGIAPPLEVTFDEYTEDIELNRLLRAAIARLLGLPARDQRSTWGLRAIDSKLADVTLVDYDSQRVPRVSYDRLTSRYRPAVELARLILSSCSFDLAHGPVPASAFLIDMNRIFEAFVVVALREALGVSDRVLVQGARRRSLFLDKSGKVPLEPDFSMWSGDRCTFVGDVKYKRVVDEVVPNADVYQLLAYTIATDLPGGMLIYAAREEWPVTHEVVNLGKVLRTEALDLSGTPQAALMQIADIADRIRDVEIEHGVNRLPSAPESVLMSAAP